MSPRPRGTPARSTRCQGCRRCAGLGGDGCPSRASRVAPGGHCMPGRYGRWCRMCTGRSCQCRQQDLPEHTGGRCERSFEGACDGRDVRTSAAAEDSARVSLVGPAAEHRQESPRLGAVQQPRLVDIGAECTGQPARCGMHLAVGRLLKLCDRPTGVSARSATRLPGEAHFIRHLALTLAVLAPQLGILYAPRSRKHEPRVWWVPWWHVTPSAKPVGSPRLQAPSKGVPAVLASVDRL